VVNPNNQDQIDRRIAMKRIMTSILTIAAVAVLAVGPSFAAGKGSCCDGGACCNNGCCKLKHHTK
jgi:hypothetical protein